jgi:hypothetical protein
MTKVSFSGQLILNLIHLRGNEMPIDEIWKRYAAIWSADEDDRTKELGACLHPECTYCDMNGLVMGRIELGKYMQRFSQSMPGARFRITSVAQHHGRTLSSWTLVNANESILQTGKSFAMCDEQGRFQHITGFFDAEPST